MARRFGFGLSLLAACGIHAVILVAARAPFTGEARMPTVVVDLAGPAPTMAAVIPGTLKDTRVPVSQREPQRLPLRQPAPLGAAPEAPAADEHGVAEPAPVSDAHQADPGVHGGAGAAVDAPGATADVAGAGAGPAVDAAPAAAGSLVESAAVVPPTPRADILPSYPRSARRAGLQGVVKVSVVVDASGTVLSADVLVSSGHAALDEAALEAVRRALFAPALQGGQPVACRIVVPIRFQLTAAAPGQ